MLKDKNPNMVVAVRVRPDTAGGRRGAVDGRTVIRVFVGPANNLKKAKDEKYYFDRVYDATATQTEVYDGTARGLLDSVMNGYNATVFAYGATGSGKTHTMIGNSEAGPGVMVLTIRDMFAAIEGKRLDYKYRIVISYLEVYNETIRDLLVPAEQQRPLELWEDPQRGCTVSRLSEHEITSVEGVLELLEQGNARRRQSPTEQNATSSRSHAVLQIRCEATDRTPDVRHSIRIGKLSLIDLAGSERAATSRNVGNTQLEGANINKSLLALGNCINALCEDGGQTRYVPYRNSKLTRLLRDSLGGNCRTVMIATVSASPASYEDTHNTLKYANRAKNIKMRVASNEVRVDAHVADYKRIIDDLRAQCAELRAKLQASTEAVPPPLEQDALYAALQRALEERQSLRREMAHLAELEKEQEQVMARHNAEVSRWEAQRTHEHTASPVAVGKARAEVRACGRQLQEVRDRRAAMAGQAKECERAWDKLMDEVARLQCPARRRHLELAARLCVAEAERSELRRQVGAQEAEAGARAERETRLQGRVAYLEGVVAEQQRLLADRALTLRPPPLSPARTPASAPSASSSSSLPSHSSVAELRNLRFATPASPAEAPRAGREHTHTPSHAQHTPTSASALPLRSALKKVPRPVGGEALHQVNSNSNNNNNNNNAHTPTSDAGSRPSYAQSTKSSLKRQLHMQRLGGGAEAAQKENALDASRSATTAKLWHSLQLALKEKQGRRAAGV